MSAKRKMYTAECKREAVSLITDHDYGVSEAARNLGRHANMLRKWKRTLARGFAAGRSTARRLRQEAGVSVRRPRFRGPVTTDSRHGYGVADKV